MSEPVIVFDKVSISYPLYHHITGGLKSFLLNFPKSFNSIRNSRHEVLREISFSVHQGETLGIIGRNGTGKSTTLGLIAGVLRPSRGEVRVTGRISPFLELGGGFHPELTGSENIMLNGVLLGLTRAEVFQRMDSIIAFSELGDFIDQPIRTYSSGMLARLGFSVIANLDPEILVIDEILAVGDMQFQQKCFDTMMTFKNNGVAMVFVSHAMGDIEKVCDRVIWIDDHAIRMAGKPSEVISSYAEASTGDG